MAEGAKVAEDGGLNVSQIINLAEEFDDVQRPAKALEVLKVFGPTGLDRPTSPYGAMQVMLSRACAYAQTEEFGNLGSALTYLAAHEADDVATRTQALLCANNLDGAAELYIRRLAQSKDRAEALMALSTFLPPKVNPPWAAEVLRRQVLVAKRPDVQAAIARAGHTETIALRSPGGESAF